MSLSIIRGESAVSAEPLVGKRVAILGYGNQGRAHALNLRDSRVDVVVGARPDSPGSRRATTDGFEAVGLEAATGQADLVVVALPDEAQPDVFKNDIRPALRPGSTIGFLHGFCVRYGLIDVPPEMGVVMVAPKGPGVTLRDRFTRAQGIPCLFAVHQDPLEGRAEAIGLAWARGIGCARAGIILTSFADEAETDLFGEQAVLCGGMSWLILLAFETLVEAGYPPELAYLECCHEVKQVADLIYERGLAGMMRGISNTAEFGACQAGPRLVDGSVRERMQTLLTEIRSGQFARELRTDYVAGFPWFDEQRASIRRHPIEAPGEVIRDLMPWLKTTDKATVD